jgi:hypothetical protein
MQLSNIASESDLREWIKDLSGHMNGVKLQWVEPSLYGSSVGAADVIMKFEHQKVDVELKYLYKTSKGIKYTLRPAQRRYHRMGMFKGNRSALLFVENGTKNLCLVRGDHISLRDYAADTASGCRNGDDRRLVIEGRTDISKIKFLKFLLFESKNYWREGYVATG